MHAWLTYERLGREAENQALTLARTVASDPSVRAEVLAISQQAGTPPPGELLAGPLMAAAEAARTRTGALFVVITDETGLRLAHPDADRLGEKVSTDPSEALAGQEVTTRNTGTLGPSAGAKVSGLRARHGHAWWARSAWAIPRRRVGQSLQRDIGPVALTAAGALLAGVLASFLLRRRLQRLTLGLEPEEISTLVHDQVAVLQGVDDGVIGVSADGRISVFNAAAQRLLGQPDLAGTPVGGRAGAGPAQGADAGRTPRKADAIELVAGGRVLVASARKALHRREDLGWVVMLRDRTELQQLTRQLDAVGTMSTALRAQRHEFANQLHTIAGFMSIGQHQQAREYLARLAATGPLKFPVDQAELLQDPYLQAFVGAKGVEADERGVTLRIGPETLVRGQVTEPQDVTTVLGNLIDNAVNAAVAGSVGGPLGGAGGAGRTGRRRRDPAHRRRRLRRRAGPRRRTRRRCSPKDSRRRRGPAAPVPPGRPAARAWGWPWPGSWRGAAAGTSGCWSPAATGGPGAVFMASLPRTTTARKI